MPTVPDKYRGTDTYRLVYEELTVAAFYRITVSFQQIAQLMGLPVSGIYTALEVGYLLGEISEDEHIQGRPMLSAVAVDTSGAPGDSFYGLAKELGKLTDDSPEARKRFWEQEKAKVYKTWAKA